jgi:translation initiation factor IF-3
MKHCTRLLSPAQCVLAALTPTTRSVPRKLLPPQSRSVYRGTNPTNPFFARARPAAVVVDRLSDYTKDEAIEAYQVCVRGPDVNGHSTLSEPQTLRHLLRDLDREKKCIIQLSKPGTTEYPIVQIADKEELLKQAREKEKHAREQQKESRDKKPKQIEMNWAIDGHDLGIKMKQLESFLEKGKKVEILLAAKRKGRKAELAEGMALLKQIRARMVELDAKEVKTMEGEVLKQATLIVQKKPNAG